MTATIVSPRLMRIGGGSVTQIAEVLGLFGLSRPLIVTDPWMLSSGTVDRCLDPLRAAGLAPQVFAETVPDPTDTVIEAGVAALRAGDYDCLVGFGGGSPMDTAKAMAILAAAAPGQKMRDFKVPAQRQGRGPRHLHPDHRRDGERGDPLHGDHRHRDRREDADRRLGALPLAAIVDYELTFSVPQRTTADTGIDSLTHALEAYVSKRANPHADSLALSAMRLIGRHCGSPTTSRRTRRRGRR